MKTMFPLLGLVAAALAGCGAFTPATQDQRQLALACEVTQCTCLAGKTGFSFSGRESRPVEWRPDGSAACPDDYLLSRSQ